MNYLFINLYFKIFHFQLKNNNITDAFIEFMNNNKDIYI